MTTQKMHPHELSITVSLVDQLISSQFPQWSDLPLKQIESAGTDNAIFRLGGDMMVRLPRLPQSSHQIVKEQMWLPKLAPYLPLKVPAPLASGAPNQHYPCAWSVCRWIEGKNATDENISDRFEAALRLGQFVSALQKVDTTGGPLAGEHNFFRGVPLSQLDHKVRPSLESLEGIIDVQKAERIWDEVLKVPEWKDSPRWVHGDIHSGNLLAHEGKLVAVIDFGGLGVGDPACDMMLAWTYLSSETRKVFRDAVQVDDATWKRGQGWALYLGLVALPYYLKSNPVLANIARRSIDQVFADQD